MAEKIKAGVYYVNVDDRNNRVDYCEEDYWHRTEKYQVGPNVHYEKVCLKDESSATISAFIYAEQYMLTNPRPSGLGSFFNPMAHYDKHEYDHQRSIRDSLIVDDSLLDRDNYYDPDDL